MNSPPTPSRQEVIVMLLDGVARVGRSAKNLSDEQWDELCCGQWTAAETARHLLSLSRAHHRWLDAAISGDTTGDHAAPVLDPKTHAAVRFLADISGPDAIAEFVRTAGRYANRVADHWDRPTGVSGEVITVGQQCALAALEFHLHAWDLSQLSGQTLDEPPRVKQLLKAVSEAKASQASGFGEILILTTAWVRLRYKPWHYLLSASGRNPDGTKLASEAPEPEEIIDLRSDSELPLPTTERTNVPAD